MGLAYLEENRLEEAEAEFRRLTELVPEEPMGFANLGLTFLRQGQYDAAEESLREGLELSPTDPDIRLLLAKVLELVGRVEEAREVLEGTVSETPDHLKTLYALAQLPADPDDTQAGARREETLRRLMELAPTNVPARLMFIETLLENGKADEALANLEALHSQIPEFPPQAASFFDQTVESMRSGDAASALRPMTVLGNFLKVSGLYQAGVNALEGPGGVLIGFPVVTFSTPVVQAQTQEEVLAALTFTDVTDVAGLSATSSGTSGTAFLAAGDFDGDGDTDVYAGGGTGGILLRNDLGVLSDVTEETGTSTTGADGAVFGDYDNDGYLDLFVAYRGGDFLFRNQGDGTFQDVSEAAGVRRANPGTSAPVFLDADHDGDLDLFLSGPGPNRLYRNNGDGTFLESAGPMGLAGAAEASGDAAFGDFDVDAGLDLLVAQGEDGVAHYRNLLEGRFQDVTVNTGLGQESDVGAMALGDYNNDGFLDLFVAGGEGPRFFLNRGDGSFEEDRRPSDMLLALGGMAVEEAAFLDFDNDGWLDLLVAGEGSPGTRGIRVFRNAAPGQFDDMSTLIPEDLGPARAVTVLDYAEDGDLDLLVTEADGALRLLRNDGGDGNHYLKVRLNGLTVAGSKNNHFGVGATVEIRAGDMYQMRVVDGPVTHFGLGPRSQADVMRIVWTNGVPQNVFYPGADQELLEEQVLKGSCPFLYAWNGERYEFVTDVMWRSALGMPMDIMGSGGRGYASAAASREYIRIPGDALQPRDGVYSIQVTGELWETGYVDEVKLMVVDHPDSLRVVLDERFVPPGDPTLRIYGVAEPLAPIEATDEHGRDLLPFLLEQDDRYVSHFKLGRFQGLTEMHDLILDPGELDPDEDVTLFLNGWIFPTDASINVALSQSDEAASVPPHVQVIGPDGQWQTVIDNISFPSGKAKTMVVDLAEMYPTADRRVRIRTNMQIYWDHAYFATGELKGPEPLAALAPTSADLHYRGFSRVYRKGGRYGPFWFDYSQVSTEQPWLRLEGLFTRFGDVTELLQEPDDMYVVFGPGDEITVEFDVSEAPPLPEGWRRDFLLYSDSWLKDADLNTGTGQTVDPLPFHGMSRYPYGPDETYPGDPVRQEYLREYNTRRMPEDRLGPDTRRGPNSRSGPNSGSGPEGTL
jgi:cytochrome c-type biogenesis protein CcmH/NrfG